MSMNDATPPSSAADRAHEYRRRRAEGIIVVPVEVGPDIAKALVSNFLLDPQDLANRCEVGGAIETLLLALSQNAADIDFDWFEDGSDEARAVAACRGDPARHA